MNHFRSIQGNQVNIQFWGPTYTPPAGNSANINFPILRKTITKPVVGLPNSTNLKWAWFDQSTPDLFESPISKGTVSVTDSEISIQSISFLNSGTNGFLVLSTTDGTVSQCQSNAMPCEVP